MKPNENSSDVQSPPKQQQAYPEHWIQALDFVKHTTEVLRSHTDITFEGCVRLFELLLANP